MRYLISFHSLSKNLPVFPSLLIHYRNRRYLIIRIGYLIVALLFQICKYHFVFGFPYKFYLLRNLSFFYFLEFYYYLFYFRYYVIFLYSVIPISRWRQSGSSFASRDPGPWHSGCHVHAWPCCREYAEKRTFHCVAKALLSAKMPCR